MTILDDLSFQLYSARFMGELEQQFEMLAALGYRKVEPYGGLFADVPRLQRLLTKYGMTAPTAHVGVDLWRADARATAKVAATSGSTSLSRRLLRRASGTRMPRAGARSGENLRSSARRPKPKACGSAGTTIIGNTARRRTAGRSSN